MNKDITEIIKKEGNSHKWVYRTKNGLDVTCYWKRNDVLGVLYGYISISPTSKLYNEDKLYNLSVHGGITYKGINKDDVFEKNYFVIGFDCGHSGDLVPYMDNSYKSPSSDEYRDRDYVESECENLAEQVSKFDIGAIRSKKLKKILK